MDGHDFSKKPSHEHSSLIKHNQQREMVLSTSIEFTENDCGGALQKL